MKARAAVLYGPGEQLHVEEIDLDKPHLHEVLVKVVSSGICGSDVHVLEGDTRMFGAYPVVPGHEVAGIVEEVGVDVTMVTPGDHVLINLFPGCGYCAPCCLGRSRLCSNYRPGVLSDGTSRMSKAGNSIFHMASVAGFADHIVVSERGCVKVREDAPLDKICLISCGVATGFSAVFYGAQVMPGSSAVVVGCGGVGLNVIQFLSFAHASTIIAVDVAQSKLDFAKQFGATHAVNSSEIDPVEYVQDVTSGGADFGFEVITKSATVRQAFEATRPGGKLTIVGIPSLGDEVQLPAGFGRSITNGGWTDILAWRDFPLLVDLYMDGKVKVDELISRTRPLEEINEGFADLRAGTVARTVLQPHG